jgi:hypothetical protein
MNIPPVPAQPAYLAYLRDHGLGPDAHVEAVTRFVEGLASPASHDELEALAAATRDAGTIAWCRMRPFSADAVENSVLAVCGAVQDS